MGFEAIMTKRGRETENSFEDPSPEELAAAVIPMARSKSTPVVASNDFLNDTFEAESSDVFAQDIPSGGWKVTPRLTPQQQENTQRISDDFDAAWASMPTRSFFPEQKPNEMPSQRRHQPRQRRAGPVHLDVSYDTTRTAWQIQQHQLRLQQQRLLLQRQRQLLPSWSEGGIMLNRSGERGAIEVSPKDDPAVKYSLQEKAPENKISESMDKQQSTKRRGFLRAFIRREKKRHPQGPITTPSVNSGGVQSLPSPGSCRRPQAALPIVPMPAGFLEPTEMESGRGRRTLRSNSRSRPPRTRSNSLERFRTASMAQKFSRVMRLYEHD